MGNSHAVLEYAVLVRLLETFLFGPLITNESKRALFTRTNLHNVVQNPDERVAILEPGRQVSSESINSHKMKTHFRNTWNFCNLYLVAAAVVRVVWRRFCGGLDWSGPEEDAFARKPLMKTH